jgi:hypothetical protein
VTGSFFIIYNLPLSKDLTLGGQRNQLCDSRVGTVNINPTSRRGKGLEIKFIISS